MENKVGMVIEDTQYSLHTMIALQAWKRHHVHVLVKIPKNNITSRRNHSFPEENTMEKPQRSRNNI